MKSFVAILALVALAAADVSHLKTNSDQAAILKQEVDVRPDGYDSIFETSNGIVSQESAALKAIGKDQAAIEVQGSNQYTSPDGQVIRTDFIANELGYQPQGSHLPTPPAPEPIPEYIQRALAYIEAHPPAPEQPLRRA